MKIALPLGWEDGDAGEDRGEVDVQVKKATILIVILATAQTWQAPAKAHPISRFDACGKPRGVEEVRCAGKTEVGKGVPVAIRAEIAPPHIGAMAWVLRLQPHADRWERVAVARVSRVGAVRWYWTPRERDIHNYTAWRFRFKIPAHGRSNIVRVLVRSDEF